MFSFYAIVGTMDAPPLRPTFSAIDKVRESDVVPNSSSRHHIEVRVCDDLGFAFVEAVESMQHPSRSQVMTPDETPKRLHIFAVPICSS
jgi:hypothetical protein